MRAAATLMAGAALAALASGLAGMPAWGDTQVPRTVAAESSDAFFDLPILPLAEALRRYGEAADRSIFFETGQLAGRRSAPVHGRLDRDEALRRLLAGTGMRAWPLSPQVVTVEPVPSSEAASPVRGSGPDPHYDGYLQQAVMRALCAEPGLRADRQRIAMRFSVASSRIQDLRVRVAEQPELEPLVRRALTNISLTQPPPDVPQPVVMIVSPQAAARWGGCPK
ncbi:STN domain-containing protein [Bordetella genomosp. 13]|uniref:STN domain-containing protein n=1 Tax=Bordetella genomosp. 13 TaxID=463040 RepID=UPI0011AAEB52|nr:STN domain-containing protein [Bordetella genomosp. 13]